MSLIRVLSSLLVALLLAALPALADDVSNSSWSEIDASNTATPPNGWPSGSMTPIQVEPASRAQMGGVKRFYDHINMTQTSGGSANVQTLTYAQAPQAYVSGDCYLFSAGFTNTGAMTLNVNGLGATSVVSADNASLQGGEVRAGWPTLACYDGTNFRLPMEPRQYHQQNGGYVMLPGSFLINWGQVNFAAANSSAVTFGQSYTTFVGFVGVSVDAAPAVGLIANTASVTTTGFTFNLSSATTTTGRWVALGF